MTNTETYYEAALRLLAEGKPCPRCKGGVCRLCHPERYSADYPTWYALTHGSTK